MTAPTAPVVSQLAQTHLQLFQQLHRNGYSAAEVAMLASAYRAMMSLFANRFRSCGTPFVVHLVGTSAVLVWLKLPIHVVLAGLAHAAYQEGDFPNSLEGMTARKRQWLAKVIGTEAEALVATYAVGSRSVNGIRASYARFAQMSFAERHVLRMQLANELDDYRDLAANHAANADERIAAIRQTATLQVEMAEWLGHSQLAQALQETYAHAMAASIPAAVMSPFADAHPILPNSCRIRPNILARRLGVKIRNRLRRHAGIG